MGKKIDKTLIVAVVLLFGAVVLGPRWTTAIYSTKGIFVQIVGFGGVLWWIREQRRRYRSPPNSLGCCPKGSRQRDTHLRIRSGELKQIVI